MALPDYPTLIAGTAITWTSSGGDKTLNAAPSGTGLANGSARQGDKNDFYHATYGYPVYLDCKLTSKVQSAATAGNQIELYFGESGSATAGTDNPGGLGGSDATLSNPDEIKLQLSPAGALTLSNALGTGSQVQRTVFYPNARAVIPVIVNKSGQSISNTGTDTTLVVTPYYAILQD